jgi:O6-methylguanine-DNA--protein-cysteine methyltransferase
MRLKLQLLLVTVFAAGLGASFAFADDGNGKKSDGDHGSKCTEVHVNGTVAAQTLTVTLTKASKRLNLAAGSQVVLQLGGTGQTVRVNAEACSTTTGTTATYQVKSAELKAKKTTTATTTTAQGTTTAP